MTSGWICIMLLIVHGSPTDKLGGPKEGGGVGTGEEFLCTDIAGREEWESLTSFAKDNDGEDLHVADADEDDVTANACVVHVPCGGIDISSVEEKYSVDDGGDVDPTT